MGDIVKANQAGKHASIPVTVLFYMAWRNLISKKLRSFLTVFGIIIGIGAIFFLLSFGLGLQELVTKQVIGDKSIKAIEINSPNSRILKLDNQALNRIKSLPHVDRVSSSYSFPGSVSYKGGENDVVTYGIDKNYIELTSLTLSAGRFLNDGDTTSILVNVASVKVLGISDAKTAIGKTVTITVPLSNIDARVKELRKEFTIVGVLSTGSGSEVYLPAGLFDAAGVPYYSQSKLIADKTENVTNLRKQIESLGFQTVSPIDTLDQINQIFKFFTVILVGFGGIGMIVSVLGMFNTLTISLLERTREIGLMIALGARNRDMSLLFIIEGVLLSVFGAIIGIVLAVIAGQIVNYTMNQFAHKRGVTQGFQIFSTPLWAIGALILFMVVVGLVVVRFPARRAQKINPIDALRRE